MQNRKSSSKRRGAASVVLAIMMLGIVLATAGSMMRARWAFNQSNESSRSFRRLNAALDAVQVLPVQSFEVPIKLSIDDVASRWIIVQRNDTGSEPSLTATEYRAGKPGRSVTRIIEGEIK